MGRVLIVDDSKAMRTIVKRQLRQAGFTEVEVDEAENGRQALEVLRARRPDVVLSDWNMPEMNGLELLRALRAGGCDVCFGFVTSEGSPDMRALAIDQGAAFLIAKPFTPDSFRSALVGVL